jgi:hypothetical protein
MMRDMTIVFLQMLWFTITKRLPPIFNQKYAANGGLVIDIGCGKGTF